MARFLISSYTTNKGVMYFFLALAIGGFALSYQSPVSILALIATLVGTVGAFYGTGNAVRYAMMLAEVFWVIHNIIVWSPVAVAMEALFFASNVIGLIRHRRAPPATL